MTQSFEIIVIGGGHAGVEAALASARRGARTALATGNPAAIGRMSCNPALGGLGKGHLIREVDALGGQMGISGDATGIQFRRLNMRKGAAVRGTRVQSDKAAYAEHIRNVVNAAPNLQVIGGEVVSIDIASQRVTGVSLADDTQLRAPAVILTTGTFLSGLLHVGDKRTPGGRVGEHAATALSQNLRGLGLRLGRLKTGTPCRLDARTIDTARMETQPGDDPAPRLSYWTHWPDSKPPLEQRDCHLTYTNEQTHAIIRDNLERSPMYSGVINSKGPRYCPSIEDKVVRFADRKRHQIFVEPEGLSTDEVYPNGISTSLPADVQERLVHSIAGFEQAKILQMGYAVEYDYADPTQLDSTLQLKNVHGLYFAGQINGTTGYEEAAGQGLIAGINAVQQLRNQEPFVLRRDEAYIGVMIDDLVTRGVGGEPYRMFTSRAEYRLLLREDCAAARLTPHGRELGLIDDQRFAEFETRQTQTAQLSEHLDRTRVKPNATLAELLERAGTTPARLGATLSELLRRPEVGIELYAEAGLLPGDTYDQTALEQAEIGIKYAPYIERQMEQAQRLQRLEHRRLPEGFNYSDIPGLSHEIQEKLSSARPRSLGQASRIPGVTPAAIAVLDVQIRIHDA